MSMILWAGSPRKRTVAVIFSEAFLTILMVSLSVKIMRNLTKPSFLSIIITEALH